MKQPSYANHEMTTATKLLGFESTSPQQTFNYPVTGAFIPFIPSDAMQFIGTMGQNGPILGPSMITMTGTTNQLPELVSSVRNSAGNYTWEFPEDTFLTKQLYVYFGPSRSTSVNPTQIQMGIDTSDTTYSKVNIVQTDLITQSQIDGINIPIHLILI